MPEICLITLNIYIIQLKKVYIMLMISCSSCLFILLEFYHQHEVLYHSCYPLCHAPIHAC